MRPVRKGSSPIGSIDYTDYRKARPDLVSRISNGELDSIQYGHYCSYCERRISTNLAVEHIQHKGGTNENKESSKWARPDLIGRWSNFLLSCVNCNSAKGTKSVFFNYYLFPDRDNTFYSFEYTPDGHVKPNPKMSLVHQILARNTLQLLGLDKDSVERKDFNGKLIAEDRVSQRMCACLIAKEMKVNYDANPNNSNIKNLIVKQMLSTGFFSVWMRVFSDNTDMKNRFIDSISGTRDSGCFSVNGNGDLPHPNLEKLQVSKLKDSADPI